MSIKSSEDNSLLTLQLDNGDREKFKQALEKWKFKDEQSLLRFVISVLMVSNENVLAYLDDENELKKVSPADHLLKTGDKNEPR